ncbi:hypothetical protein [Spirosoma spitsbergense]|uniref:hypothetical protein n=1 Tax=Spirosoma spitsbergense TaxID=431554 RepID=UPI00035E63C8|nr:hypothetical protein [Spirosoma spitsbergense]
MRQRLLLSLVALFLYQSAPGQTPESDSLFVQAAKKQAVNQYEQAFLKQEHVYEGNEYIAHDHRIKIHPFYPTDSLLAGTITYNDIRYHDVLMLYDIVRQEVAVQPPEGGYRIQLHTNKVSNFSLGQHRFIRLINDSTSGIVPGFYELLYDGRAQVLAQRVKTVHEDISSGTYVADYLPKDRFFIRKDGQYHEVKTKGSFLSLFPDRSKTLRKYLRANHLKFNDEQREMSITRAAKQYEEISGH